MPKSACLWMPTCSHSGGKYPQLEAAKCVEQPAWRCEQNAVWPGQPCLRWAWMQFLAMSACLQSSLWIRWTGFLPLQRHFEIEPWVGRTVSPLAETSESQQSCRWLCAPEAARVGTACHSVHKESIPHKSLHMLEQRLLVGHLVLTALSLGISQCLGRALDAPDTPPRAFEVWSAQTYASNTGTEVAPPLQVQAMLRTVA
mmetsp:Transcript_155/g.423  ORF Transcript_155/g.423 Transcript_155/m.423 type:complete len:200 (-) Transcript_155:608-1207(-)